MTIFENLAHRIGGSRQQAQAVAIEDEVLPVERTFPRRLKVGPSDRAGIWAAKVFAVIAGLSFCLNLLQASIIHELVPLRQVIPLMLSVHPKSEQVIAVEALTERSTALKVMTRYWVREWVEKRNELQPDGAQQARIVDWIARRSTPEVIRSYREQAEEAMQEARQRKIQRRTIADPASVTEQGPDFWLVDFVTVQYDQQGRELKRESWRASLRITFVQASLNQVDLQDLDLTNPWGFTVTHYVRNQL
ncbi:MAG: hypothetical protein KAY22_02315 [Rhizorhabdus sp.]|uniref:VirB8/TrbF family protein n=1 Tax=Rhizorhabdus sp. TaxID=1968843 RepID=UPI001B48F98C|nr:VirB8/TrbF family protein [Rhizorhabdus sp.]MBP8231115.1 hypothetical protein [Rhizorhabdus sp.]